MVESKVNLRSEIQSKQGMGQDVSTAARRHKQLADNDNVKTIISDHKQQSSISGLRGSFNR